MVLLILSTISLFSILLISVLYYSLLSLLLGLLCCSFYNFLTSYLNWILISYTFLIQAFKIINFPLSTTLMHPTNYNLWYFHYHSNLRILKCVIYDFFFDPWMSMFLNYQIYRGLKTYLFDEFVFSIGADQAFTLYVSALPFTYWFFCPLHYS